MSDKHQLFSYWPFDWDVSLDLSARNTFDLEATCFNHEAEGSDPDSDEGSHFLLFRAEVSKDPGRVDQNKVACHDLKNPMRRVMLSPLPCN
jgi:hypothetical protein